MRRGPGRRGEHKRAGNPQRAHRHRFRRGRSGESMPLCQHCEAMRGSLVRQRRHDRRGAGGSVCRYAVNVHCWQCTFAGTAASGAVAFAASTGTYESDSGLSTAGWNNTSCSRRLRFPQMQWSTTASSMVMQPRPSSCRERPRRPRFPIAMSGTQHSIPQRRRAFR